MEGANRELDSHHVAIFPDLFRGVCDVVGKVVYVLGMFCVALCFVSCSDDVG